MLSTTDIEHFIRHGFVVVPGAIDRAFCAERVRAGWERTGYDPLNSATWSRDRLHLSGKQSWPVAEVAPRAWEAICQLCGGAERIENPTWSDAFIINFRIAADQPWSNPGPATPGWHKDGDFFQHFLDSPEQALLTIVIWQDVASRGGATFIAADSVPPVARYLAAHPEGVHPCRFPMRSLVDECHDFREAEGRAGDVYLLHPYLLHASSPNLSGIARFITNPPVHFREPMRFAPPASPVELAICRGLGAEQHAFKPTAPRQRIVPERVRIEAEQDAAEAARRLR
jgi:ectoine hydroxylase-related dioxygenase (phytanoyl-CoA dioxygenase family)